MSEFPFGEKVIVTIGKAEALILFQLLADFHSQPVLKFANADRLALVRLHGALESTLVEPFSEDYADLLDKARNQLLEQWWDEES
jgi:hypothetical protein